MTLVPLLVKANLTLHGVYFLASGVLAMLAIEQKMTRIGLTATSAEGIAVFKVIYCGLMMAIGAIFLVGLLVKSMERFSMIAVAIVAASLVLSRLFAFATAGTISSGHLTFMFVEMGEFAVTVALLCVTATAWKIR